MTQQTPTSGSQQPQLTLNSLPLIESLTSLNLDDPTVAAGTLQIIKGSLGATLRQDVENVNRANEMIANLNAEVSRAKAASDLSQQQTLKLSKAASMLSKALTSKPSIEDAAKIASSYGLEGDNAVRFAQMLLRGNSEQQAYQFPEIPQPPQQQQLDSSVAKPSSEPSQPDLVERLKNAALASAAPPAPGSKAQSLDPQMQMILNEVMALKQQNEELKQQSLAQEKARLEELKRNHLTETLRKGIKIGEGAVAVSDTNVLQFLVEQFAPQMGAMEFITVDSALASSLGLPQGQKVLADPGTGHTLDQLIKDFAITPVGAKLFEQSSGTRGAGGISPNNSTVISTTTPTRPAGVFKFGTILDVEGSNEYGKVNMVKLEFALTESMRTGNSELTNDLLGVKEEVLKHYSTTGKHLLYSVN